MSDSNLDVRARLTAINEMSAPIRAVISDIKKFESAAKRLNSQFSTMRRAGTQSFDGFGRAAKSAADQMRGLGNIADRVAASSRKADQDHERSASRMYTTLMRDERQYQALLAKRGSIGLSSSSRGRGTSIGRIAGGTFLGVGAASEVRQLVNDVISMERNIGRSIAAALRSRFTASKAESQAEIFGDMSTQEVQKLRKNYLDRLGIKFGNGIEGTLGVATELSKAGLSKKVLGDATELVLKAQKAMDISSKETAELFGGLSSFLAFDKSRYASISNSIAIANRDSKASGAEIIEGMKRGLSAISVTGGKLTPEQLSGLVGAAIDVGIRPGKSGNFISQFVGNVGSADTAHGQKGRDLQDAASRLGFGGRAQMALAMRNSPLETVYKLLDGLAKLPEKMRIRVAKDIGGNQWFDELLSMVLAKDKLKQIEKDIATDRGFLDKAAVKAISSMSGARASVIATAKLAQERAGAGFDRMWTQISAAILRHADSFDFGSVTSHFESLTNGLLQGFGLKNWGQAVDWLADQFSASTIETWKSWGLGFSSGIKSWGESLMSAFNIIKRVSGFGNDPESTGKFVANLTALATSLVVVNPMLLLFAGTMALLTRPFGIFIASVYALKKALDWVADKMFSAFVSVVDAIKGVAVSMINHVRSWIGLSPIGGGGSNNGASGSWTDSGSVKKQSSYTGTNVINPQLLHKTAFHPSSDKIPAFGAKGAGIIRHDGIMKDVPSFSESADTAGLSGNAFLKARRARFAQEIKNDPSLRLDLAAMQMTEGASKGGTIESLMNRMDMQGWSLRKGLGYSADGKINPKSFYGPVRRGKLGPAIEYLKRHPKEFAKYDAYTQRALMGGHVIGGYTDQGLPTNPNGSRRTGIPGFKISPKDGNEFTDWAGVGRQKSINFRHFLENGIAGSSDSPIGNVPTPSEAISNVPLPKAPAGIAGGQQSRGGGPVNIHINGSAHDPEAIATLVQRRIDESMNWRTHDTASEYT